MGKGRPKAHPVLAALDAQVADTIGVEQSAIELISGIANRIQAAVDQALANGATAAELEPVTGLVDAMRSSSEALAAAVAANSGA